MARGQLHFLTGSATEDALQRFGSTVFRVDVDGRVKPVSQIVPDSVGTGWVDVSYDWRKAVFLQAAPETAIVVADFDTAAVVKKCKPPLTVGMVLMSIWLADNPAMGPSYNWHSAGADVVRDFKVEGMTLDPAVPCKDSFQVLEQSSVRYFVTHGKAVFSTSWRVMRSWLTSRWKGIGLSPQLS